MIFIDQTRSMRTGGSAMIDTGQLSLQDYGAF
jgi:hypothetical protein